MRLEWSLPGAGEMRSRWAALRRISVHLTPFVRRERRTVVLAVLAGAGAAAMTLARPWPLKVIFDHVLGKERYGGWLAPIAALPLSAVVGLVSAGYLLVVLIEGISTYWQQVWTAQAGQKVVFGLRKKTFNHLMGLSLGFHGRRRTGELLMHLTGDIQLLKDMVVDGAVLLVSQSLVVAGMFAISVFIDPTLAVLSMLVIPLLAIASLRVSNGIRRAVREQRRKEGKLAAMAGETLSAIAVVQAFGRERRHSEEFAAHNSASLKQGLRTTRLEALLGRVAEVATAIGVCSVLYVGTLRSAAGHITPGDLIVFLSYLTVVYRPLRRIARFTARSSKAMVCSERLVDLLEVRTKVPEWKDATVAPRFRGGFSLEDVSYTYPGGKRRALRRLTLAVEPGELVALCGTIGSGKTTLAASLLRLFDPDEGHVRIDGEDVRRYTLESLRGGIAVVPQEPLLFHASVRDNIAYGEPEASQEQVEAAARAVGAHEFIERMKDGYATVVGEKGRTLSAGQRQLIALARALIKDAPIIILDEPTANLDAVSRNVVRAALRVLLARRTAILITHTLTEAAGADRVVVMQRGEIAEIGTWEELSARAGWFRQALAAESQPGLKAEGQLRDPDVLYREPA